MSKPHPEAAEATSPKQISFPIGLPLLEREITNLGSVLGCMGGAGTLSAPSPLGPSVPHGDKLPLQRAPRALALAVLSPKAGTKPWHSDSD